MATRTFCQREILRDNRRREKRGEEKMADDHWRPATRGDCRAGPRPCCYVGCRHNLFLDVTARGGLRIPFGENPEQLAAMPETCALDVAERGGMTLEQVAKVQSLTRERVRQIEVKAMRKLEAHMAGEEVRIKDRLLRSRNGAAPAENSSPDRPETAEELEERARLVARARREAMVLFLGD